MSNFYCASSELFYEITDTSCEDSSASELFISGLDCTTDSSVHLLNFYLFVANDIS